MRIIPGLFLFLVPVLSGVSWAATDPCEDFYRFACEDWMRDFKLPPTIWTYTASYSLVRKKNRDLKENLLHELRASKETLPPGNERNLALYFSSCMDVKKVEVETEAFVSKWLSRIDELSEKRKLAPLLADLRKNGIRAFFSFGPSPHPKNPHLLIPRISSAGLGLPDAGAFSDPRSADMRKKYRAYMEKVFGLSGSSPESSKTEASAAFLIEEMLSRSKVSAEDSIDPENFHQVHSIRNLKKILSEFAIEEYFSGFDLKQVGEVDVSSVKALEAFNGILKTKDITAIRSFLKWTILRVLAPDLNAAYQQANYDFYQAGINGAVKMRNRETYCVTATENALGEALGEAFVKRNFQVAEKESARVIFEGIRSAFRESIEKADWIDEETREKSLHKLDKLSPKIGFRDHFPSPEGLEIGPSFLSNLLSTAQHQTSKSMRTIGQDPDPDAWEILPQVVNARYSADSNEALIPAGILQKPFFSADASIAENLAGIGIVIGHEISHGFDTKGRKYDAEGKLGEWWTKASAERFDQKTSCLVEQFGKFEVAPGEFLSGVKTLRENTADLGGVKLSYQALKKALASNPPALSLDGLTEEQRFFLLYAKTRCAVTRPEAALQSVKSAEHSPDEFRVNGVLANLPEFAEAYHCSAGSKMVRTAEDRCSIW